MSGHSCSNFCDLGNGSRQLVCSKLATWHAWRTEIGTSTERPPHHIPRGRKTATRMMMVPQHQRQSQHHREVSARGACIHYVKAFVCVSLTTTTDLRLGTRSGQLKVSATQTLGLVVRCSRQQDGSGMWVQVQYEPCATLDKKIRKLRWTEK